MLSDGSADEGERSRMSIFVRFIGAKTFKSVERFLGMVRITISKKAADLHDAIMCLLASKALCSTLIRFYGMDGTNALGGERPKSQNPSYLTPLNLHKLQ